MDKRLYQAMYNVNQQYFNFSKLPLIQRSRAKNFLPKSQKSVIFGSYRILKNTIAIHPILLEDKVPLFVLEFVIYHELLHYQDRDFLVKRYRGARVHTRSFKDREALFLKYNESKQFLKSLLKNRI